ncbi:MAG: SpoIIE family protein phosphatase, partial [Candidatus Ozemobacteraceae bacterium]
PFIGAAFLGFRSLPDQKEILVSKSIKEARDLLLGLDSEFAKETKDFETFCRELRDDPTMKISPKGMSEKILRLQNAHRFVHFEVRSLQGEILINTMVSGLFEGLESFFDSFGKMCILSKLSDRLNRSRTNVVHPPDEVTQALLKSPQIGFSHILQRKDTVQLTQFGTTLLFWYWDTLSDLNHPVAFITVLQSLTHSFQQFLERKLNAVSAIRPDGFTLLANDNDLGRWFPKGLMKNRSLENLAERIKISQNFVLQRIKRNGTYYLAVGAPGRNLHGYSLLALFSEEKIDREIAGKKRAIVLALIFSVLFSASLGVVLSELLLKPIGELSKGLEALRKHDTSFRVSFARKDELGDLAQGFNRMVEDLKEMDLAKVVQEALSPENFPTIPGYQGKYLQFTAAKLGGDYCDFIPMPDGRTLMVIGDVTGHGVGPALLMAMVKAEIFQLIEGKFPLDQLMERLDHLIFQNLRRKLCMTLFAAFFEPATGKISFCNGGHPYPFLVRKEGSIQELEGCNAILGGSEKRQKFSIFEDVLNPGDVLFLFTDGLYEATNPAGEAFGFNRMRETVGRLSPLPVDDFCRTLFDDFLKYKETVVLNDDFTIIALKRNRVEP